MPKDLAQEFASGFVGMTTEPIALEELLEVRSRLKAELVQGISAEHRILLAAFQLGKADWGALPGIPRAKSMPAVLWKAQNFEKLPVEQRAQLAADVENVFGAPPIRPPIP